MCSVSFTEAINNTILANDQILLSFPHSQKIYLLHINSSKMSYAMIYPHIDIWIHLKSLTPSDLSSLKPQIHCLDYDHLTRYKKSLVQLQQCFGKKL